MTAAEEIHHIFRGSAELAKFFRLLAFLLEFMAATIALHGIAASHPSLSFWLPCTAFLLLAFATAFREYSKRYDRFAQRARRISADAFGQGIDLSPLLASSIRSDQPVFGAWFAARLPASTLDEYYEPRTAPGENRLREMWGHSAFYTWRLSRLSAWTFGALGLIILFISVLVLHTLATTTLLQTGRAEVLDALYTVVLAILLLRSASLCFAYALAAMDARRIADRLVDIPLLAGRELDRVREEYDVDRVASPPPPTVLYRLRRDSLAMEWQRRRAGLVR